MKEIDSKYTAVDTTEPVRAFSLLGMSITCGRTSTKIPFRSHAASCLQVLYSQVRAS